MNTTNDFYQVTENVNINFSIDSLSFHVIRIINGTFSHNPKSHFHGKHIYEFHFNLEQSGSVIINDTDVYHINPNTVYVTGPLVTHRQRVNVGKQKEFCLLIEIREKEEAITANSWEQEFLNTPFYICDAHPELWHLAKLITQELTNKSMGYSITLEGLTKLFVIYSIRSYFKRESEDKCLIQGKFKDYKHAQIEWDLTFNFKDNTLSSIANKYGFSERQFERYLKHTYDMSFTQIKNYYRMSTAALLLQDTDKPIGAISEETGFSSIERFGKTFRKYYEMSPSEFRKKFRDADSLDHE